MDNTNFSLRRLSDEIRLHVIKTLDYLELVSFSFTSSKSKLLVKSFNIPIEDLVLTIDDQLYISICPTREDDDIEFYIYDDQTMGDPPRHLDVVSDVILVDEHERWEHLGLSFNEIFQHLLSLFKVHETSLYIDNETEEWDSVDVRNLVRRWDFIHIVDPSDTYVQKLSDSVIPITKDVTLKKPEHAVEIFQVFPQKIGIQNLDYLHISSKYRLTLDDALEMNAGVLALYQLSVKEANRFVKSWLKGSNPRMKRIYIGLVEDEANLTTLLKGLKYQAMPEDLERRVYRRNIIRGGFDIRNKRGQLATIHIEEIFINLIVWD